MGIFVVILWFGIGIAGIGFSVYLATGEWPRDWNWIFAIALLMPFAESLRWWAYFLTENRYVLFWCRVAVTPVFFVALYFYADLQLGREKLSEKLIIAFGYPGAKLPAFLIMHGYPKHA